MRLEKPDKTGINAGSKFLLRVKRGGEMQLITVTCRGEPYTHAAHGGTALYVDVFGWGYRGSVNIKKLLEARRS
jgi:hypothetical protein